MGKDPAFLFYSKDWLEGTMEMSAEEKGVYIDLLAHQHQKGSLPPEPKKLAKLAGMSEVEFGKIWAEIGTKFIPNGSGRLVNRKLSGIVTERVDKGWRNKIIGTLAAVIKYSILNGVSKQTADEAKKTFKVDNFLSCTDQNLTERVTEWYQKRLKSIGNGNEDGNATGNDFENKTSTGSYGVTTMLGQMMGIWTRRFPTYTAQKEMDGKALHGIASFIFENGGVSNGFGNTDAEIKALNTFELIADQVSKEEFWKNKPLKSIANNIQEFYNKIKNPTNGTSSKPGKSATINDDTLKQKAADYLNQRRQAGC